VSPLRVNAASSRRGWASGPDADTSEWWGADSDKLVTRLRNYGIELIFPHRSNRKNRTQDRRRLRRYRRRWKIERLFAWLQNFRRLVVRYERYAENFLGMLYLVASSSKSIQICDGACFGKAADLCLGVGMFPTTNGNAFLTYVFSVRYVGRGGGDRNCIPTFQVQQRKRRSTAAHSN
jgi:Transposase DDE domain